MDENIPEEIDTFESAPLPVSIVDSNGPSHEDLDSAIDEIIIDASRYSSVEEFLARNGTVKPNMIGGFMYLKRPTHDERLIAKSEIFEYEAVPFDSIDWKLVVKISRQLNGGSDAGQQDEEIKSRSTRVRELVRKFRAFVGL